MNVLPFAAITLFCDDVRSEIAGTSSVVGILPDNVEVDAVPGVINRLTAYTRIIFDANSPPTSVELFIRRPNGVDEALNVIGSDIIAESVREAGRRKGPLGGLIGKATAVNFPIAETGRIMAIVRVDGVEYVTGSINVTTPVVSAQS